MAAPDVNLTQLAGGRLFYGVTDLTIAAPYGGIELGLVSSVFVRVPGGVYVLGSEESGGANERSIYTGGDAVAGILLATWDPDAVAALFPGAGIGTQGGPIAQFPSLVGQTAQTISNLLHVPTNPEHNAWLMPIAQPSVENQARLAFSHRRWLNYPMVFRSQEDGAGRALLVGKLEDLA